MIKSYKLKRNISNTIIYIILTVSAIIWIMPLAWLVMTSFRGETQVYIPYIFPKEWTFDNYIRLFTDTSVVNYPRWFLNTLVVAACSCVISTVAVLMVSYTFSRLRFKSRKKFLNIGMILGMFPGFMTMIAVYYLLKAMGLTQNLVSLIIVYSAGAALGYFIAKGFFDTIPRALDEAATIDGATKNQIFWKIILPMSKPIVVYTVLTSFTGPWADFILARVIMGDNIDNYTIALGLWKMVDKQYIDKYFLNFCAGAVVIAIPITALFLKMQKYYVEGVTGGAVKG
ncbi:MAG TPA: sugar ABC transporter permease [Candidatus Scatavimonas merdigallinarum]|uniref:Sugar ABC transporter permease n=1 Tax=Candidatus Scatavimonas merdigallinarum TaxID=2840914 RepID=A0A9D0ZK82_9FIRM|nr:sugar ABC transporter permease [Candidatus Scatavimonas merdigallinarum]